MAREAVNSMKKNVRFIRKKKCKFCIERIDAIDYKDVELLSSFTTERGKIILRRITGTCAYHQRHLAKAIRLARNVALIPFVAE